MVLVLVLVLGFGLSLVLCLSQGMEREARGAAFEPSCLAHWRRTAADGSEFPFELAITRIPLEGPPSFTGHLRDITERKRAEQALRRRRRQSRASDGEGCGSWICPSVCGLALRIVLRDEALRSMTVWELDSPLAGPSSRVIMVNCGQRQMTVRELHFRFPSPVDARV